MKRIVLFVFAFTFSIQTVLFAQSEKRNVDNFSAVSMGIAGDLYITQGSNKSLEIKGDPDDLEDIVTEVKNSTLVIRYKNRGWNIRRDRVSIYLTTPEISKISLGGSGKIMSENSISSDRLDISVSGSGKMILEVEADEIEASISGSGNMTLTGDADMVDLTISGSGSLDAEEMMVDRYQINISGSGKSRIKVGDELEARISGSGSVYYTGDPDKVISNVSGSGRVRKF